MYATCPKCKVTRNLEEALDCPKCLKVKDRTESRLWFAEQGRLSSEKARARIKAVPKKVKVYKVSVRPEWTKEVVLQSSEPTFRAHRVHQKKAINLSVLDIIIKNNPELEPSFPLPSL